MAIDKASSTIDVYDTWAGPLKLKELKEWCEFQLADGKTEFRCEVDWGYYSEISGIDIIAEKS